MLSRRFGIIEVKSTLGEYTWQEVEPYLDRALELSGREREEYVSLLGADRAGIALILTELLADGDELRATGFLETSMVAMPEEASLVGQVVGAYTIQSAIGHGGMGEVWLALRSDGRFEGKFAIKFLDSYATSPAAIARFRREGRLLARLSHPHIARLIDAGVTSAGRPYLVLEYVDGRRIDDYAAAHALTVHARVRLLMDVLAALTHAHARLIVHRDIKPSNVLVTEDGSVKLLDFGIAKLLNPDTEEGDSPTRIEEAALTPEFAAPEQLLGEPATIATDVYQLGVLMFVLLAGRLPLIGAGPTRAERIKAALDGEPLRLSGAASGHLRRELRGDLDAIASKALRKLPQERYATAEALADDLERYLDHLPVSARANLLRYRFGKFVRRYRAAVIGTAVAAAVLIGAAVFASLQMREAQRQRDRVLVQAKRAEKQAEFVTFMMSTVGYKPTTAEQLLDAGHKLLGEHYIDDAPFRATALINLSARYADLNLTNKQYALLLEADAIARKLNDPPLVARVQCGLAQAEIDLGHMGAALEHLTNGRSALARVRNPDPLFVEDCIEAQADLAEAQGNPTAATQYAEKALALLEEAGETHDVRYAGLLGRIADYYKATGNSHKGFEYVERALAVAEKNGLGDTDASMTAKHNVASGLMGFGEVKHACAREAEVVSRLQATGRTVITAMAVLYGRCFQSSGEFANALFWYDAGLAAAQSENEAYLQMHARAYRAAALIRMNRLAEASAELDRVDALARAFVPFGDLPAARARMFRAELLLAQRHPDQAQEILDRIATTARVANSSTSVLLVPALLDAVDAAMAQGCYAAALDRATEALLESERRARVPAESADVGESLLEVARAKGALHDLSGMQETARRATIALTASLGADNPLTRASMELEPGAH